jgi:hypothetical protein
MITAIVATVVLCGVTWPASGESLFDALFGGMHRRSTADLPAHATPFADPFGDVSRTPRRSSELTGPATAYCVRTCDGRFFPVQQHANVSVAESCKSFCPASQTAVFHGSKIDNAVGPRGIRYSDMENAFAYRKREVENCTCNGRDPFGLARIDVKDDPTLKAGDIVATPGGLVTVQNPKTGEFTPINPSSKLANVKVAPATRQAAVAHVGDEPLLRKRRNAQASR